MLRGGADDRIAKFERVIFSNDAMKKRLDRYVEIKFLMEL